VREREGEEEEEGRGGEFSEYNTQYALLSGFITQFALLSEYTTRVRIFFVP
jgi:hypothetical protein